MSIKAALNMKVYVNVCIVERKKKAIKQNIYVYSTLFSRNITAENSLLQPISDNKCTVSS